MSSLVRDLEELLALALELPTRPSEPEVPATVAEARAQGWRPPFLSDDWGPTTRIAIEGEYMVPPQDWQWQRIQARREPTAAERVGELARRIRNEREARARLKEKGVRVLDHECDRAGWLDGKPICFQCHVEERLGGRP